LASSFTVERLGHPRREWKTEFKEEHYLSLDDSSASPILFSELKSSIPACIADNIPNMTATREGNAIEFGPPEIRANQLNKAAGKAQNASKMPETKASRLLLMMHVNQKSPNAEDKRGSSQNSPIGDIINLMSGHAITAAASTLMIA
jgi:hypothetical protein